MQKQSIVKNDPFTVPKFGYEYSSVGCSYYLLKTVNTKLYEKMRYLHSHNGNSVVSFGRQKIVEEQEAEGATVARPCQGRTYAGMLLYTCHP